MHIKILSTRQTQTAYKYLTRTQTVLKEERRALLFFTLNGAVSRIKKFTHITPLRIASDLSMKRIAATVQMMDVVG